MTVINPSGVRSRRRIISDILYLFIVLSVGIMSFILLKHANPTFMQAISIAGSQSDALVAQPYLLNTGKDKTATLLLDLDYSIGQNATIIIEPDLNGWQPSGCVDHIWLQPLSTQRVSVIRQSINKRPICEETTLDFSPYLHPGINQIILETHSDTLKILLYINPQLFGAHALSTLACLGIFAAAAAALFCILRRTGLNAQTSAIAAAGMIYYALWLHLRPNMAGVEDLPGHLAYIQYMIQHWMQPYGYGGWEGFHPPLYYFLAGRIFDIFSVSGIINPIMAVRILALILYMIFCTYGLHTLHEAIEKKGLPYYLGCLLIIFWPVAMNTATSSNNDVPMYAVWGAVFYYLARWFKGGNLSYLQLAIGLTGLAFMIKSNAWVLVGMSYSFIIYALFDRRLLWQQLLRGKTIMAFCALLLGVIGSLGKLIYMRLVNGSDLSKTYLGDGGSDFHSVGYFVRFDFKDFVMHPFTMGGNEPDFLNFFLKSALYSENQFSGYHLLFCILNILLVMLLFVTIVGIVLSLIKNKRCLSDMFPYLMGTLIPLVGSITFMVYKHWFFCQNFRYVLPMLIPLIILYVYGMETLRIVSVLRPIYWLGVIVGLCLPFAGMFGYLGQYIK